MTETTSIAYDPEASPPTKPKPKRKVKAKTEPAVKQPKAPELWAVVMPSGQAIVLDNGEALLVEKALATKLAAAVDGVLLESTKLTAAQFPHELSEALVVDFLREWVNLTAGLTTVYKASAVTAEIQRLRFRSKALTSRATKQKKLNKERIDGIPEAS